MSKHHQDENRDIEMKIDSVALRARREGKAWSQEHLAEITGLSLRTIQRVEAEGKASHETRLALAAAFDCQVSDLGSEARPLPFPFPTGKNPSGGIAESVAVGGDAPPSRSSRNLWILPVIATFLLILDLRQNGTIRWAQWPLLGLGIAWIQSAARVWIVRRFPVNSRMLGFVTHGITYVLVCGFLAFMDIRTSGRITWSQWPMLGWGFGLCMHGLSRFRPRERKTAT